MGKKSSAHLVGMVVGMVPRFHNYKETSKEQGVKSK
jgi:hypothetical protein